MAQVNIYAKVTQHIIEALENGAGEWARPGIDAEADHIELINEGSAEPAPLVVTAEEAEAETEELAE